jgi:ABC-type multidrug transport system fused ATPase/permease subunit
MGGRKVYVLGVLFLVFEAATAVVEPYPIAFLIDYLQGARESTRSLGLPSFMASERWETILVLTLAIILIAAVNSAADSLTEVCMARGGRSLGYSIRVAMYSHLQRLPLGYHDKKRTGDVLTRVTGDVLVLEDFVVKSVSNILGSLLVLVGSFAFLLTQSWSVALVAVTVIPLLALVSNYYSRRIKIASKTQRDREGDLASTAQEMLTSIRLVQSYGRGTVDLERFSSQTGKSMFASLRAANIQAQFSFVIALVEALSIAAVIWLGVWLVDRRSITIGTLVLFVLLLQNMFKPARKIVSEWYKIGKVFASVERVEDLLNRDVVVTDLPNAVPAPPLEGRLAFRNVRFSYPAEREDGTKVASRQATLKRIDFEVAPGEVVALVGHSGAGKSTIAQLVPRLYDPDSGQVLVDGLDVTGLTLASLRRQVSLVLQETVLLSGTVAENIGYGIEDATREGIEAAARMANAHEFIMAMPDGYQTALGERGSTLSGGQRQRLAIARAFIRRAPILILDEPTTGLDAESSQSVVSALRDLMQGTTTIVISHDPALIRCADRILVIADGRVAESGRHDDLMRAGGRYADLYAGPSPDLSMDRLLEAVEPDEEEPAAEPVAEEPAEPVVAEPGSALPGSALPGRSLVEGLEHRLPGLATARDEDAAREHMTQRLLAAGHAVEAISTGKFWLREDGTCSLRYDVAVADAAGRPSTHTVLGRVHPSDREAQSYLAKQAALRPHGARRSLSPWRHRSDLVPGAGLALHVFPIDAALPTLERAMNTKTMARLLAENGRAVPPGIDVVHHPREGACVLRYTLPPDSTDGPGRVLYGKVYPDHSGDIVDGFLRALARRPRDEAGGQAAGQAAGFPVPVLYAPTLRLLVTESLPGEPLIPSLLKALLQKPPADRAAEQAEALREAVRAAGLALAALHGSDLATAPVHTVNEERAALGRDLDLVSQVWPDVGATIRRAVDTVFEAAPPALDVVLSHGDFTPSQVLLDGASAAVVDLDTLCWADPSLDLGRFLAQLHLLALKQDPGSADALLEDLTDTFLRGYGDATARTAAAAECSERIAFYKATTAARSALHACRQLKSYRVDLALSLLESINARRVDL